MRTAENDAIFLSGSLFFVEHETSSQMCESISPISDELDVAFMQEHKLVGHVYFIRSTSHTLNFEGSLHCCSYL